MLTHLQRFGVRSTGLARIDVAPLVTTITRSPRGLRVGLSLISACFLSVPAAAQMGSSLQNTEREWTGHLAVVAANVFIGAITGGTGRALSGERFADGFWHGTLGGVTVSLGKQVAGRRFFASGMLGRQIAAIGTSVVRNTALGRAPFETIDLPMGPFPLELAVWRRDHLNIKVRLNLTNMALLGYGVFHPDLRLDVVRSVSAGAPVFRSDRLLRSNNDEFVAGLLASGVVFLSDPSITNGARDAVQAHEQVHLIQFDFFSTVGNDVMMSHVLRRTSIGRTLDRYFSIDLFTELPFALENWLVTASDDQPTEREADFLSRP